MSPDHDGAGDAPGDFFALPPFNAEAALLQFKRTLRDARTLTERGNAFSFEGQEVLNLQVEPGQLVARLARRPARSPDWETRVCRNAADVRKLQDDLKRRLLQWADE
ncbi:hypothetical protein SAMN05216359_104154 [Roseateles sp. YR242]|uniref:hypothetical protein n=1 Tax=Roseateles sp. YR242 TaxID=1855305 RepID=UPI0008B95098|nr:hypothetical protein [Roseateles sp. YR242]SEK96556.1 hypothetical protein SAMN05216359_104154 [Roseateles sp. YR242]